MPTPYMKKISPLCGKSLQELEKLWTRAKEIAKKQGMSKEDPQFYALVTGIFKNMLGKDCKDILNNN